MSWGDHSPEVLALREQVKRLTAENAWLRQSGSVPRYSVLDAPDLMQASYNSHTLQVAATARGELDLDRLHVMVSDSAYRNSPGARFDYYVSSLEWYQSADRAGILAHMHERLIKELGEKLV